MRLQFLGTGDAAGLPVHGCRCSSCAAARVDPARARGPCSALLEFARRRYLIDAGAMDLVERFPDDSLAALFLTHFHVDHVQGLFRLRWSAGSPLTVYCPGDKAGCADLYRHPGILRFTALHKFTPIELNGIRVTPLPLIHSKPTLGWCFDADDSRIAYLTDTRGLPPKTLDFLRARPPTHMVIDTRDPPGSHGRNHNDLDLSLGLHRQIGPRRTWLTHLGHQLDCWLHASGPDNLPTAVRPAHDGLTITC